MTEMRSVAADDPDHDPDANMPEDYMARMSDMLMEQSLTLNEIFLELTKSAADNHVAWPGISKDYVRLALRAQSNCRASLAAMANVDRLIRSRDEAADAE